MTIQILKFTADPAGPTDTRVYFTLIGLASDDVYRQTDFNQLAGSVIGGDEIKSFIDGWVAANTAAAQAEIDSGTLASNTDENAAKTVDLRKEAKQFLDDNPQARALIDLSGPDLETEIENRTAGGENVAFENIGFCGAIPL